MDRPVPENQTGERPLTKGERTELAGEAAVMALIFQALFGFIPTTNKDDE